MEELMHKARMRVLQVCLIILVPIVSILVQMSLPSPLTPSKILNLAVSCWAACGSGRDSSLPTGCLRSSSLGSVGFGMWR